MMKKRWGRVVGLNTLMLLGVWSSIARSEPVHVDSVDELVKEAIKENPMIRSTELRSDSLEALVSVAGKWSDPVVGLELSNLPVNTLRLANHPMAGAQLRVQQRLRPLSWSEQSRTVAQARVDSADFAVEERKVALQADVRIAWWELTRVRQQRVVTADHVRRTEELLGAVLARYETGGAGQHAVLRLQVLRDRLEDSLSDHDRSDAVLTAHLNGLLARAEGDYSTSDQSAVVAAPKTAEGLIDTMVTARPTQARLLAESRVHASAAELAKLNGKIDPSVWMGYRLRTAQSANDPGRDLVSVGVGVPLPFGSRKRAQASKAAELTLVAATEASKESDAIAVGARLRAEVSRWQREAEKAAFYEVDLIPAAEQTLETTLLDYSVSKADFASLFDAEVTLLDLSRAQINATINTHLAEVRASAWVGTSLVGEHR